MAHGLGAIATRLAVAIAVLAGSMTAGCRDRDPNTPITLLEQPVDAGGVIELVYTLRNPDTRRVNVTVSWAAADGVFAPATPAPGSPRTTELEASPGGTVHRFLWDALADLGPGRHQVRVRVEPRVDGRIGSPATSLLFTADNSHLVLPVEALALARQRGGAAEAADGAVVVASGAFGTETERFDPPRGTMSLLAPLVPARQQAAVVTLLDLDSGFDEPRPAVLGGVDAAGNALAEVQVYDAGEDLWQLKGSGLLAPRAGAQATVLPGGVQVLLSGGHDGTGAPLAFDEVYDVRTELARAVAGPGAARTGHTATLLPDGRVLIAGGTTASGVTASTLLIDPRGPTPTATVGPPLAQPRSGHGAAIAAGLLVVFGGRDAAGAPLASLEAIAADLSGSFAPLLDGAGHPVMLLQARADAAAAPLGTRQIVISGGRGTAGRPLGTIERLDVEAGLAVAARTELLAPRDGHSLTPLGGGAMLVTGGGTAIAELYLPPLPPAGSAPAVSPVLELPRGRAEHAAAALASGRVLVAGGTDGVVEGGRLRALADAVLFDPAAGPAQPDFITSTAVLATPRRLHTATALGGERALIAGGMDSAAAYVATLEIYDGTLDAFVPAAASLPTGTARHAAVSLPGGRVLIAGGATPAGTTAAAFLYDPALDALLPTAPMARPRERFALLVLADGRVLAAGGWDSASGTAADDGEVFDPQSESWSPVGGGLGGGRFDMAAAVLAGGDVLLAGGRPSPTAAAVTTVAVFAASSDTLVVKPVGLATPRAEAVAVPDASGRALIAGGATSAPLAGTALGVVRTASVELYDPAAGGGAGQSSVPAGVDLPAPVAGASLSPLPDGEWLQLGGRGPHGAARAGAERIRP
ncbi:MAG: hypothetical protein KatS3mg102_0108 [Planctomycetota bacterium]|nr:MAG: hypothetical protein KatS3mg102_0108 [Planctomycetota bacterium]